MKVYIAINQVADMEAVAADISPFTAINALDKLVRAADPKGETGRAYTVVEVDLGGSAKMTDKGTRVVMTSDENEVRISTRPAPPERDDYCDSFQSGPSR